MISRWAGNNIPYEHKQIHKTVCLAHMQTEIEHGSTFSTIYGAQSGLALSVEGHRETVRGTQKSFGEAGNNTESGNLERMNGNL